MKKIGCLVLSVLSFTILTGCGTQTVNILEPQTAAPQQQLVTAQSNQGFNNFMDFYIKHSFQSTDLNHDGFISYEEFVPDTNYGTYPATPPSTYGKTATANTSTLPPAAVKPLPELKVRFAQLDKNRDAKLTFAEAKSNIRYFIGKDKANYRKTARLSFDAADKDKNASISEQEFTASVYDSKYNLSTTFLTADVNKNRSLNFSEYEDIHYAQLEAYLKTPYDYSNGSGGSYDPGNSYSDYNDPGYGDYYGGNTSYSDYNNPGNGYGGSTNNSYGDYYGGSTNNGYYSNPDSGYGNNTSYPYDYNSGTYKK